MGNEGDSGAFSGILKKLVDLVETREFSPSVAKQVFLNRIDLTGFKEVQKLYAKDRSLCKKVLEVPGKWRIDLQYGPQFETRLKTERAGEILVQMDDLTMYGGEGTGAYFIQVCLAGFCGCFSAAFAKWTAMEGIELRSLKIKTKADTVWTTSLGIKDNIPMVDKYSIELTVDTDAPMEKIQRAVELTKKRCFCYYCITTPIFPNFVLKKDVSDASSVKSTAALADKIDEKYGLEKSFNRINLNRFKETRDVLIQNPSLGKKTLQAEGRWRLGVQYGPQFEMTLQTEKAGEITVQTDETLILGGGGTSFNPVVLCIAGFSGDFLCHFARWAGLQGIELKNLKSKARMAIDLTSGFGIEDGVPMIEDYQVEIFVESDASMEKLLEILEIAKKRSFCHYCYNVQTIPEITVKVEKPETKPKEKIKEKEKRVEKGLILPKVKVMKARAPIEMLHIDEPHYIKLKTGRVLAMTQL